MEANCSSTVSLGSEYRHWTCRLNGYSIGLCEPAQGQRWTLDIDSSVKAARFVRFCDAFNIPILTLVDVPGSYRDRSGARWDNSAWVQAPIRLLRGLGSKLTVIVRKAYGGAYDVLGKQATSGLM